MIFYTPAKQDVGDTGAEDGEDDNAKEPQEAKPKKAQDRAKELETVDKPFLQVDRLDDEGDKVEAEVEGGEVVEGSHQQRLDLVFKSCLRNGILIIYWWEREMET